MSRAPLLLEIGCEEIPARMIAAASKDLGRRLEEILDGAGLSRGVARHWGGPRRLAVHVEAVEPRQADRDETVIGPPAAVAFDAEGRPSRAAQGFARKQGIEPEQLRRIETDKGEYAGFDRHVTGRTVGEVLAAALPGAVAGMWFPKTMRWGDGKPRWVRPVHWLVALHGEAELHVELFGIAAGRRSAGHRFHGAGTVEIADADGYLEALEEGFVLADPAQRRERLRRELDEAAAGLGGRWVADEALLAEAADLVEWPAVVPGSFDRRYLELPRELLVTTLRHHQKCFSVEGEGALLPAFLAVSNNHQDPGGHIRRGNEWVVGGRLEDARFFWNEDRKRPLEAFGEMLGRVVFHAAVGTYADKARRLEDLAERIATHVGAVPSVCGRAAALCKNDLMTGTVGEFPELQGEIGGLLIEAAGGDRDVARGIYEHYRPAGADDAPPESDVGAVVSLADKLDSVVELIAAGEVPTGSRDPLGLRRASSGLLRIAIERRWPLSLRELDTLGGARAGVLDFLRERCRNYLREAGYSANEVQAVFRPRVSEAEADGWPLHQIVARLDALRPVRERDDFAHLVDLTKRVDNILTKNPEPPAASGDDASADEQEAARELARLTAERGETLAALQAAGRFDEVIDLLASFVAPVDRFFDDVLVIDPDDPAATARRQGLLLRLRGVLTHCFDIRELAGQADRRS